MKDDMNMCLSVETILILQVDFIELC